MGPQGLTVLLGPSWPSSLLLCLLCSVLQLFLNADWRYYETCSAFLQVAKHQPHLFLMEILKSCGCLAPYQLCLIQMFDSYKGSSLQILFWNGIFSKISFQKCSEHSSKKCCISRKQKERASYYEKVSTWLKAVASCFILTVYFDRTYH